MSDGVSIAYITAKKRLKKYYNKIFLHLCLNLFMLQNIMFCAWAGNISQITYWAVQQQTILHKGVHFVIKKRLGKNRGIGVRHAKCHYASFLALVNTTRQQEFEFLTFIDIWFFLSFSFIMYVVYVSVKWMSKY